jgi:nitroimidazol reductase NimA-like FMN-containing flavoprotein (pyridoxamine 5'-phosphate oxidase superfamily)
MGRLGIDDLEDLTVARLGSDGIAELLAAATECTLVFVADGWPSGVVVSFVADDDRIWITSVEGRRHTAAVWSDPRVTLVVTSAGTPLEGRRMVALRGLATVHADEETKRHVLLRLASRLAPSDPGAMVRLLDTANRVVIEVRALGVSVSHDSRKIAGDGRGGCELDEDT